MSPFPASCVSCGRAIDPAEYASIAFSHPRRRVSPRVAPSTVASNFAITYSKNPSCSIMATVLTARIASLSTRIHRCQSRVQ